jgi:Tfp pilus assembly protein PilP
MAVMRILALACLSALAATVAAGQTAPASPSKTATAAAPATVAAATTTTAAAQAEKDGTTPLEPSGFTYTPDGRRDPFVSLQRRGSDERANRGTRPSGLSGISASEVSLRGTMKSPGGFVGILQGVDNKSYIVRVGDKLFDGSVRSITADAMVILQQVDDPLSPQKEREVRKQLRQTEEAK